MFIILKHKKQRLRILEEFGPRWCSDYFRIRLVAITGSKLFFLPEPDPKPWVNKPRLKLLFALMKTFQLQKCAELSPIFFSFSGQMLKL